jgi:hypothetical protein
VIASGRHRKFPEKLERPIGRPGLHLVTPCPVEETGARKYQICQMNQMVAAPASLPLLFRLSWPYTSTPHRDPRNKHRKGTHNLIWMSSVASRKRQWMACCTSTEYSTVPLNFATVFPPFSVRPSRPESMNSSHLGTLTIQSSPHPGGR